MRIARSVRLSAAAALSSVIATMAFAGPLAGTALAAKPPLAPAPTISGHPDNPTSANTSATFSWTLNTTQAETFSCQVDGTGWKQCSSGWTYTPATVLADGSHLFTLKTKLASGHSRASTISFTWVVDTTGPLAPAVQQLPTPTRNSSGSVFFTNHGDSSAQHFKCAVDVTGVPDLQNPGPWTDCSPPSFPYSNLSDGSHTAYVWAYDSLWNRSATAGTMTWAIDSTAPAAPVFDSTPSDPSASKAASFTWHDGDATSYQCSLDNATPTTCSSGNGYTGLSEGPHTFSVQGVDAAGNVSPAAQFGWTIDVTAPATPQITSAPANPTDQTSAAFILSDTDATATFLCKFDTDLQFAPCGGSGTPTPNFLNLSVGSHSLSVEAVDAAGNVSGPATYAWVITPPGSSSVPLSPPLFTATPNAYSNDPTPSFTWLSLDDTTTSFVCKLDNQPVSCSGPDATGAGTASVSVSVEGVHVFTVRDSDGTNVSPAQGYTWTYDKTPPAVPVFSATPGVTSNSSSALFAYASDPDAQFTCRLDGNPFTLCGSIATFYNLPDGQHTFDVKARDAAGNTSSNSFTWTIDTSAPQAPFVHGPVGIVSQAGATLTWSDLDPSISSSSCSFDGAAAVSPCPASTSESGLSDGPHSFTVTVTKVTNGVSHSAQSSVSWVVDMTNPTLDVTGVPSGLTNETTVTPTIVMQDANPGPYTCSLTGAATSSVCGVYSALADGTYTLTVDGSDLAGNPAPEFTRTWTVDATAPVLHVTGLPDANALVNHAGETPTVTQDDAHPGDVTCTLNGAASSCSNIDTSTDGTYTFTADTTDLANNTADEFSRTWTVDRTAPKISVVGLPAAGAVVNKADGYVLTVSDDDVNSSGIYSCTLNGNPAPCDGSFGPLADGPYTFTADTTDKAGNAAQTFQRSWTVDTHGPASAPSLASTTVTRGGSTNVQKPDFTVTDGDSDVAGYACSLGASVSTTCSVGSDHTVSFSGPLSDGSYTLSVNALDAANNPSPAGTYGFTVDTQAPVKPAIESPTVADGKSTNSTSPAFSVSDQSPDMTSYHCGLTSLLGTSTTCSVDNLGVLTFDHKLADDTYTVSVTALDAASNESPAATYSFTVDTVAPVLDVRGVPSGLTKQTGFTPAITLDGAPTATAVCSLTGPTSKNDCGAVTGLADGSYKYTVDDADAAGNPATTFTSSFVVDTTAPSATITRMLTLTGTSTVTWSEPVSGVDLSKVTLLAAGKVVPTHITCGGACTGTISRMTVKPTTRLVPGQHYTLTVAAGAASDAAHNGSVVSSTSFRAQRVLEENMLPVSSTWQTVRTKAAFGASYVREHLKGASASWTFRGSRITWWTVTGPQQGKAAVLVDGRTVATVNTYATATHYRVARTLRNLGKGTHSITIRVLGVKGARAGKGTFVAIDGFTVGVKRTASPMLTTALRRITGTQFFGSHATTADLAGQTISLRFRGTSITWTTVRNRSQGMARIYVDGVLRSTVDNYSATARTKVRRMVGGLLDTVHTVTIVVLGKHHKGARGNTVTVDRFVVG